MGRKEHEADSNTPEGRTGARSERFEWDRSEEPSAAVVEAVATTTRRDSATLSPLDEYVDPDVLDAILTSGSDRADGGLSVSFDYEGVEVTVGTDGGIEVREADTAPERAPAGPTTDAELNTMLRELLRTAFRNGLSVRGGWDVRNGSEYPDWDVIVTRIEKPEDVALPGSVDSHGRS